MPIRLRLGRGSERADAVQVWVWQVYKSGIFNPGQTKAAHAYQTSWRSRWQEASGPGTWQPLCMRMLWPFQRLCVRLAVGCLPASCLHLGYISRYRADQAHQTSWRSRWQEASGPGTWQPLCMRMLWPFQRLCVRLAVGCLPGIVLAPWLHQQVQGRPGSPDFLAEP